MKKTVFIFLFLAIFGAIITPHFGESWDEFKFYKYASLSLDAYKTWPSEGNVVTFGDTYDNYGPAFVMLVVLLSKPLHFYFIETDARHYIYFLTFLAGIWAFYGLAKRWLSKKAALFSTLLFATQPLLVGHAFISPKDIPFLAFFLLSLFFGFKMVDSLEQISFDSFVVPSQKTLTLLSVFWLISVFPLFIFTDAFFALITNLVHAAQAGDVNVVFLIASNIHKVPAEVYIQRYFIFFLKGRAIYFLISTAMLLFLRYRLQPEALKLIVNILPSAILLGLTTSTRILGPFAGLIVVRYAFWKRGRQAIPVLATYAVIAMITMYLTWPYLWVDPIGHLYESVRVMSQYPWRGVTLFNGVNYQSTNLPYSYLPVLFAIQMTEPVWALSIAGWVVAITRAKVERGLVELALLWFLIPFVGFVVMRPPLYDNFRQILFILPPVFLMAGVAFEKIRNIKWQFAVMILSFIPGIMGIISLHPYEYTYYNRFIGGVEGAQGRFELDYWAISYREAAKYVNSVASPNAAIWVEGPSHLFALFAREDLKIYSSGEVERAKWYEYVVATTRYDIDKKSYPDAEIVHRIMREEVALTVIKKP